MLTPEEIKEIDKSSICDAYDQWPEYCGIAFGRNVNVDEKFFDGVTSIVFSGMGGSGTTGDILSDWIRLRCGVPIHVLKGYHIPAFVNENTLFIAMSVSGDTEETLNSMLEATSARARVVAISHGGKMENVCRKKGLTYVKIEQRILPRVSLPEVMYSALKLLTFGTFLGDMKSQIDDSIKTMKAIKEKICRDCTIERNPAKQLAKWIYGGMPSIYSSPLMRGVGIRFKNSVNENAKLNAIAGEMLDSCHNELVSWGHRQNGEEKMILKPILSRSGFDPEEVRVRFDVFKEVLKGNGHETVEVPLHGSTPLANIVSSLYLLDYSTIYLGILRRVDPTPIAPVFAFKDEMEKRLNYFDRFIKPKLN